jgi:rod shape-determining protein MreC
MMDRAVLGVSGPLQAGLRATVDGTVSLWRHYLSLRGLQADNDDLRHANATLRGEVNELAEAKAENERLKKMLAFSDGNPGIKVPAHVVGLTPDPLRQWVLIDRGEQDGIKAGWAVVTSDGVVGQVTRAMASTAYVMLLTDSSSRIGVRVQKTRSRATVTGNGERILRLETAVRSEPLEEGDALVTSGTDGVYAPGVVVGHVTALSRAAAGMFWAARVIPAVDTTKLEEVFVMPAPLQGSLLR